MPELQIEITEGLDQELKELADAQLVTKEDIVKGTIAKCVVKEKQHKDQKPRLFGFDLTAIGEILHTVVEIIHAGAEMNVAAQEKKSTTAS